MVESLSTSSHDNKTSIPVSVMHVEPSWMDPVVSFIKNGTLLEDKVEAKKIQKKTPWYWLFIKHKLYRRSYLGPYLLCIYPEVVEALLEELHEGICGSHIGEGLCRIELLPKGIGGPTCRSPPKSLLRSATSASSMPQTFISREGSLTLFPVYGLLHNKD